MRPPGSLAALALAALLGCGTDFGPAPQRPTWVDDVEPILRANCFHCHGPGVIKKDPGGDLRRWDVYDLADPQLMAIGDFTMLEGPPRVAMAPIPFVSAKDMAHAITMKPFIIAAGVARMPPPPAVALPARDIEVLSNWVASGLNRGMRTPNAKPTAWWLNKPRRFVVSDDDHEQVLGKITCGATSALLGRSGAHDLPMGAAPPCTVTMFDGQDTTTVNLQ